MFVFVVLSLKIIVDDFKIRVSSLINSIIEACFEASFRNDKEKRKVVIVAIPMIIFGKCFANLSIPMDEKKAEIPKAIIETPKGWRYS
jgi:hypothetical protein